MNAPHPSETARSAVGYTVLRPSTQSDPQVCIVAPYVAPVTGLSLDGPAHCVHMTTAASQLALTDLPEDVLGLLARRPSRVLFVLVDTLSRPRQSFSADGFLLQAA